ncbi:MAG: hypothetical protein KF778_17570 [Rhodocyclaceae bacterium]|nr:hypothetical protein [Rhodocyclaceae bacterium]
MALRTMPDSDEKSLAETPWSLLGAAAVSFFLGWVVFQALASWEQHGGSVRMPVIAILVYKLLGKWGITGLFCAGGCVMLYRAMRAMRQGQWADEQNAESDDTPVLSERQSAHIDTGVNLIAILIANIPFVLTWAVLVYAIHEMGYFHALLPSSMARLTRSFYGLWTLLPFCLPAIYSFVFRTSFIEACGLFAATLAMTVMSAGIFYSNLTPSQTFSSTAAFGWVPLAQLIWCLILIKLLKDRRHAREG